MTSVMDWSTNVVEGRLTSGETEADGLHESCDSRFDHVIVM